MFLQQDWAARGAHLRVSADFLVDGPADVFLLVVDGHAVEQHGHAGAFGQFAIRVPLRRFTTESSIQKPSLTPIFAESMWVDVWPYATDTHLGISTVAS